MKNSGDNKKIKNAKSFLYNNIKFKSQFEVTVYKTLLQEGFDNVQYEPKTYVLWEGFKPLIPFYDRDKHTGLNKLSMKKIIDIKYTPDFRFVYNNWIIFIEAKGIENDVFYIKKKLFRKKLEEFHKTSGINCVYFEVFSKKQLLEAIQIIRNL